MDIPVGYDESAIGVENRNTENVAQQNSIRQFLFKDELIGNVV
jgi:hypothetical protein